MAAGTYKYEIDWDDTLGFQGTYDDITSRVMKSTYSRGKNQELQKANTGRAQFQVDNHDGLFSPTLATGNLYGNLKPRRRVRITETSVPGYGVYNPGNTVTSYVSFPESTVLSGLTERMTHEFWMKFVAGNGSYNGIFCMTDDGAWRSGYGIYWKATNYLIFWVDHYNNQQAYHPFALGTYGDVWVYVVATWDKDVDGGKLHLYLNGVDGTTDTYAPALVIGAGHELYLGTDIANATNHRSEVTYDALRIYNRQMGQAEVTANYNSGAGLKTPYDMQGLVLWTPMNEDTGTTVYDHGPYQIDGTMAVSNTWTDGKVALEPALFEGYIEHISPSPYWNKQYCDIYCVDGLDFLARASITSEMMKSNPTGYLVNEALTISEWDGVPRDGLVGWWSFDPWTIDGATVRDLSQEGNPSTMYNTPTEFGSRWGYCNARSRYFNGASQSAKTVETGGVLNMSSVFTLCCWIYPTSLTGLHDFCGKGGAWGASTNYFLGSNGASVNFDFWCNSGSRVNQNGGSLTLNKWNFVVGLYDGEYSDTYIAGVRTSHSALSGAILDTNSLQFKIAECHGGTDGQGGFDDIMIYNRALSLAEIKRLYYRSNRRQVDDGQDTVPFGYFQDQKARNAIGDVEDSELGFAVVTGSGLLSYQDRHFRYDAEHQTSRYTLANTMTDIKYDYGLTTLFNNITATVTPWEAKSIAELWKLSDETPYIPAGETITIWANFQHYANLVTSPVVTTDYTANAEAGGGGADMTGDITVTCYQFSKSAKLTIGNGAGVGAYITLLKVRGTYYDNLSTIRRKAFNQDSITQYQERTLSLTGKFLSDSEQGQEYCDYALGRFKDPQATPQVVVKNTTAALLRQIVSRKISDRITIQIGELGLDAEFFINQMSHTISNRGLIHTVVWTLGDTTNEDYWCLDYSELGIGTKLCF